MREDSDGGADLLRRDAGRSIVIEKALNAMRDLLDRDRQRFAQMQGYSRRGLGHRTLEGVARETVTAVVRVLEIEVGALLFLEPPHGNSRITGVYGFDGAFERGCQMHAQWILSGPIRGSDEASVVRVHPGAAPWDEMGLSQVVTCPFENASGSPRGILVAADTVAKQAYYDVISDDIIPSSTLFARQVGSLLNNFEAQELIHRRLEQLSSLHWIGGRIAAILDRDRIAEAAAVSIADDLGYDRALVMITDESSDAFRRFWSMGRSTREAEILENSLLPSAGYDGFPLARRYSVGLRSCRAGVGVAGLVSA